MYIHTITWLQTCFVYGCNNIHIRTGPHFISNPEYTWPCSALIFYSNQSLIYSCLCPSSYVMTQARGLPCYSPAAYALLVSLLCVCPFVLIRAHGLPYYNLATYALLVSLLCVSFCYNSYSWFALLMILLPTYDSYGLNSFAMMHATGPCFYCHGSYLTNSTYMYCWVLFSTAIVHHSMVADPHICYWFLLLTTTISI